MKAQIDIKTPSGQSLKGFPSLIETDHVRFQDCLDEAQWWALETRCNPQLNKGDIISITILD